jgi:hypothetical protein
VGLGIDDEVWDHSVFSKNRDRLLEAEISGKFLAAILTQPEIQRLLSDDHAGRQGDLRDGAAAEPAGANAATLEPDDVLFAISYSGFSHLFTVADEERVRSSAITPRDAQLALTDLLFILLVRTQPGASDSIHRCEAAAAVLKA